MRQPQIHLARCQIDVVTRAVQGHVVTRLVDQLVDVFRLALEPARSGTFVRLEDGINAVLMLQAVRDREIRFSLYTLPRGLGKESSFPPLKEHVNL